jgi:hypothetical protein
MPSKVDVKRADATAEAWYHEGIGWVVCVKQSAARYEKSEGDGERTKTPKLFRLLDKAARHGT